MVVETEETKFSKLIQELNTSVNVLEKIAVYEDNYKPEKRKSNYKWNQKLFYTFYTLEDISPDSYEDGMINSYSIEKKQLYNADTNNLMEYEIYRNVDDTDGYSPETMTINNLGNGLYKFYVADFTNCSAGNVDSTDMAYSNATVDVYTADGLVSTFHVPANCPGVIWEVFEIRNKRIVPLQRYYSNIDNKTWWNNKK